jgi:hypothetical protein
MVGDGMGGMPGGGSAGGVGAGAPYGGMRAAMANDRRRLMIASMAGDVAARDRSPGTKKIVGYLDQPVSMSFSNPTPLEDVLKYIKMATQGPRESGIPIYVDPAGLKEAGQKTTSPVTIDLEGVPLRTSLRLLLKQLDLAYCVKDGLLIISSVPGIQLELQESDSENPSEEKGQQ